MTPAVMEMAGSAALKAAACALNMIDDMSEVKAPRRGLLRRLWPQYGDDPREAMILEDLLREKVREAVDTQTPAERADRPLTPSDVTTVADRGDKEPGRTGELRRYDAFLTFQYGGHLRNYRTFAENDAHWARWTILILGLIAGISAAMNQLWRPGQKAASRMRGANALTSEGCPYLIARGVYQGKNKRDALDVFVDQVDRIVEVAAAVDQELPSASDDAGRLGT